MTDSSSPQSESSNTDTDALSDYLPIYLDETDEQLDDLVETLLLLERQPEDTESIAASFRLLHSIKGASAMLGLDQISVLTHHLESRFERFRSGRETLDARTVDMTLRCLDFVRQCNQRLRAGEPLDAPDELLQQLRQAESDVDERPESRDAASTFTAAAGEAENEAAPTKADAEGPDAMAALIAEVTSLEAADLPDDEPVTQTSGYSDAEAQIVADEAEVAENNGNGDGGATPTDYHVVLRLANEGDVAVANDSIAALSTIGLIHATRPDSGDLDDELEQNLDIIVQTDLTPVQLLDLVRHRGVEAGQVRVPRDAEAEPIVEFDNAAGENSPIAPEPVAAPEPAVAPEPVAAPESAAMPEPRTAPKPVVTAEAAPTPSPSSLLESPTAKVSETMRVDIDRLDELMNLAGELVINRAQFEQVVEELGDRSPTATEVGDGFQGSGAAARLEEAVGRLGRVSQSLQRGVLETRMVPIGPTLTRLKRIVRDLSRPGEREAKLVIAGEQTELDKRMIDALGDPLTHLVRNAIDHGIETCAEREAAGKDPVGTVHIEGQHVGNHVVIRITDDGRGIDASRVAAKAVDAGLIESREAETMPEAELIDLIFAPGFSTARAVTSVSGRGVGMDIVRSRLTDLSGSVSVKTEVGRGSVFELHLPLTLAIVGSLLVRIGGVTFAIATENVREIVSVRSDEIESVGGHSAFAVRGKYVPLIEIDEWFRWPASFSSQLRRGNASEVVGSEAAGDRTEVLVVNSGETAYGLRVDHAIGNRDVVVKSLSDNFHAIAGLAGATVLGDGTVALMLDVSSLRSMVATRRRAGRVVGSRSSATEPSFPLVAE